MTTYLVESYTPNDDDPAMAQRVRQAAEDLPDGQPVRYVRAIYIPEDEVCFHLFDAVSAEAVRRVSDDAGLTAQRIVEAVEVGDVTAD